MEKAEGERSPRKRTAKPVEDPDLVIVDVNDLTASEIEALEDLTGQPVAHLNDVTKPQGKMMRALCWVFRVRDDTDLMFEDPDCDRGQRPKCADCHCTRRLKAGFKIEPVPSSGENG